MTAEARFQDMPVATLGTVTAVLLHTRAMIMETGEAKAVCLTVQARLEFVVDQIKSKTERQRVPAAFKPSEVIDILRRFHSIVKKQGAKSLAMRIATAGDLIGKLRAVHEDLDLVFSTLQLDRTEQMTAWRNDWVRESDAMMKQFSQIAANGPAIQRDLADLHDSMMAITVLMRELRNPDEKSKNQQLPECLETLYDQVMKQCNVEPPSNVPAWFLTLDDIDFDPQPFLRRSPSATFNTVHHGTWGEHTRVVVKFMDLTRNGTEPPPRRWKEANVWFAMNHPNILRMYGACHVTQPAFVVCEEAQHGNIKQFLNASPENRLRQWRLLHDASLGLAHLAEKHVVHGNLKCSNILVGDDGRAKISNFGFSLISAVQSVKHEVGKTNEAAAVASILRIQAPELLEQAEQNEPITPSTASDVYSFAVCILELISEDATWKGEQFWMKGMSAVSKPHDVSDEAWDLITAMGCRGPAERLTMHQVVKRLRRLADEEEQQEAASIATKKAQEEEQEREKKHAADEASQQLQRELEQLRQQIHNEKRELEQLLAERHRMENGDEAALAAAPAANRMEVLWHECFLVWRSFGRWIIGA